MQAWSLIVQFPLDVWSWDARGTWGGVFVRPWGHPPVRGGREVVCICGQSKRERIFSGGAGGFESSPASDDICKRVLCSELKDGGNRRENGRCTVCVYSVLVWWLDRCIVDVWYTTIIVIMLISDCFGAQTFYFVRKKGTVFSLHWGASKHSTCWLSICSTQELVWDCYR